MSGSLGFECSAHTVQYVSGVNAISLYSDAVVYRNADYTVTDWLGSATG